MFKLIFGNSAINKFQSLKERVGNGLAIVMLLEELPDSFYSRLTDWDWEDAYKNCKTQQQRSIIIRHLQNQEKTFNQWLSLSYRSETRLIAKEKMKPLAKTFNQWHTLYNLEPTNEHLVKMEELAISFDQWHTLYEIVENDHLENMEKLTILSDKLNEPDEMIKTIHLRNRAQIKKHAAEMMIKTSKKESTAVFNAKLLIYFATFCIAFIIIWLITKNTLPLENKSLSGIIAYLGGYCCCANMIAIPILIFVLISWKPSSKSSHGDGDNSNSSSSTLESRVDDLESRVDDLEK